jgi:hypothetical protein
VTVNDDDGGQIVETFIVVVDVDLGQVPVITLDGTHHGGLAQPTPLILAAPFQPAPSTFQPVDSPEFRRRIGLFVPQTEQKLMLRVVFPSGREGDPVWLEDDALKDLNSLFRTFPDNRYRVYLVRPDGTRRLVLEVDVVDGRPIDLSDESEEILDRPAMEPDPMGPSEDMSPLGRSSDAMESVPSLARHFSGRTAMLASSAMAAGAMAFVGDSPHSWAKRVDRAMEWFSRRRDRVWRGARGWHAGGVCKSDGE